MKKVEKVTRNYVSTFVKSMVIASAVQKAYDAKNKEKFETVMEEVGFRNKENTVIKRLPGMTDIELASYTLRDTDIKPLVTMLENQEVATNKVARTFKKMMAKGTIDNAYVMEIAESLPDFEEVTEEVTEEATAEVVEA